MCGCACSVYVGVYEGVSVFLPICIFTGLTQACNIQYFKVCVRICVCVCICVCMLACIHETDKEYDVKIFWPGLIIQHVTTHHGTHVRSTSCTALSLHKLQATDIEPPPRDGVRGGGVSRHEQGGH